MGEKEEVTTMVLKVDLQCHKCYKKVKKVLCKFPQIQDQIYDEKQNQVVIKVVCCSPEKIRDKICCKGGSAIKSIKIKEPEKPKDDSETKITGVSKPETKGDNKPETKGDSKPECDGKPKCDCKPKCDDKPKCDGKPKCHYKPKCDNKPKCNGKPKCDGKKDHVVPECPPPVRACCMDCCQWHVGGPCCSGYGGNKKDDCKPNDPVVQGCPPPVRVCCMDCCQGHAGGPCCSGYGGKKKDDCKPKDLAVLGCPMPVRACCMDCYQGHADGPCYNGCGGRLCYNGCGGRPCYNGCGERPCYSGYGGRPAPYIQYDGYYRRHVYDSYGSDNMGYCVTHPDYFSEENPPACPVM